jgi:hypothetical protein
MKRELNINIKNAFYIGDKVSFKEPIARTNDGEIYVTHGEISFIRINIFYDEVRLEYAIEPMRDCPCRRCNEGFPRLYLTGDQLIYFDEVI